MSGKKAPVRLICVLFGVIIASSAALSAGANQTSPRRGLENAAALSSFFKALRDLKAGRRLEPVRIVHYGDSHTAADILTADIRRSFQNDFGYGGPGYIVARNPFSTPRRGVDSGASSGWTVDGVGKESSNDGFYGLAGFSLSTDKAGERIWLQTVCNHFEVYFLKWPGGATIDITVDGASVLDQPMSLNSDLPGPEYFPYDLPSDGEHRLEIRTVGPGRARVLGIVAERIEPNPGVAYDVMGINGARLVRQLSWNDTVLVDNVIQRKPDLIIVAYGTNEVTDSDWSIESYSRLLKRVLDTYHRAAPDASLIVFGPPDRGDNALAGSKMPQLIEAQRRAAREAGAAFWSSYDVMGGAGSMNDWAAKGLGQGDHVHLTSAGYAKLADIFYEDLMKAYAASKPKPINVGQTARP